LVDPHIRILSTANVPPQQRSWWAEKVRETGRLGEIPTEVVDSVIENVSDFPISLEEAKEIRLRLMDERKAFVKDVDQHLEETVFAFCEH
jgi:adenylosuccinate lyase